MGNEEDKILSDQKTLLGEMPRTPESALVAVKRHHASVKHYEAIGRVIAEWAYFEHLVSTWTLKLAQIESTKIGICFTSQIQGPRNRMNALVAVAKLQNATSAQIEKLEALAKSVKENGEKRNRLAHDPWNQLDDESFERLYVNAPGVLQFEWTPVPLKKILGYHREIVELSNHLDEVCQEIAVALPPSFDRKRPDLDRERPDSET